MISRLYRISTVRYYSSYTDVRVRFAPSPTGRMHLGSLRTALYNYLFAKSKNGQFIVRIEDTDQNRLVDGVAEEFEQILTDYDLKIDESPQKGGSFGPYQQSKRLNYYHDAVKQLIDSGHAYRCFCTAQRLEILKKNAIRERTSPKYDNHCRHVNNDESEARKDEPHVVRFKFDKEKIDFDDIAYGHIHTEVDEGDFIIMKSDHFPTYHLANVVDDHHMQISHVIRGQEWLASVPKHVKLYRAFQWQQPKWLHLPLIMRNARSKLSKRDEDGFADYYYHQKGYLRSAILNLLIRNGSGIRYFDVKKFYELEEMIEQFDESLLGTRSLQLDTEALDRYARLSIAKAYEEKTLNDEIRFFFNRKQVKVNLELLTEEYLNKSTEFLTNNEEAFSHLGQLIVPENKKEKDMFSFLFTVPNGPIELPKHIKSTENAINYLNLFINYIDEVKGWDYEKIKEICSINQISPKHFLMFIRISTINNVNGPPISELFEFYGSEEIRKRLERQVKWLKEKVELTGKTSQLDSGDVDQSYKAKKEESCQVDG
ncbi:unnamed protein product [Bursaphelenchus okinawaensis]|uniref:Nondiscriminating glutamyl-tRNA synthetase EARS2, mitochondrial n=1 Tax=Bursaphelenchus okinawaensis TaxID=465554 RepID=A0A811LL25_9BILA|nr:unnamed protein product [Bursaphelenchus okinawaensis]CAG9127698.1 unnamed protein product [Bursaphelenchus okinawaensis]